MAYQTIDIHVHFGSPEDKESGCYWSKKFEQTAAYAAMLLLTKSLFKKVDMKRIQKHLLGVINGSKHVDKCVLLAMDQVYDENGTVHPEWTHLHVPNHFLVDLSKREERVLFGASVHPYRGDWAEELDYCLENKAVLCKWIPSSQMIDPSHKKCDAFYKRLADHSLPLLCHAGPEYSIPTENNAFNVFNNPKHLRKALDQGVTVIIAHCALPYFWLFDVDYQDDFNEFKKLFEESYKKGWKLYADLSALTGFLRLQYIEEDVIHLPHERFVFGSDYPIPLSEISYNKHTDFLSWICFILKAMTIKNPLDKNHILIREMGFKDCVFSNAEKLFSLIQY